MCSCDFDGPDFYGETVRKSRRSRRCYDCGVTIAAGERYECASGKWDGDVESFSRCLLCAEIADAVEDFGCCWTFGGLRECAENILRGEEESEAYFLAPECVGRLGGLLLRQRLEAAA